MKNFRRNTARFFERNRNKGIPNLMLILAIIKFAVYFLIIMDKSGTLYNLLCFSPSMIAKWQVWRLLTFIFLPDSIRPIFFILSLLFYFFLGRSLEGSLGTLRFNLYFFVSLFLLDAAAMTISFFNASSAIYCVAYLPQMLDYSLLFAFAIRFGDMIVRIFFILPLKMKYLAWFDLLLIGLFIVRAPFPAKLLPIAALLPCVIFFFSEIPILFPSFMHRKVQKGARRKVLDEADYYKRTTRHSAKNSTQSYRQKCTVCGRTDTQYPDLEFRYCSKCRGYHCFCMDHINDHVHITDE